MNYRRFTLAALLALAGAAAQAYPVRFQNYSFDAYVVQADGVRYREFVSKGDPLLKVRPNEEYSIVVKNPLPVRVGVAVSIDGLNSVDGKRTSAKKARKWIIEPHGQITISGWQTSSSTNRKFVFTQDENSYADWRDKKEGKNYSKNIGVIGVAWFWNADELHRALHPPKPFDDEDMAYSKADGEMMKKRSAKGAGAEPSAPSAAEGRAGTGMGQEQQHSVVTVEFNPTAGMYSNRDCLKIYYEFAKEPPTPLPFVSEDEEEGRFAPDMK